MKQLNNTEELELQLASSGFYECFAEEDCDFSFNEHKDKLQDNLNNAPAYFAGNIVRMNPGTHQYLSTRNNNFSNRAQNGKNHRKKPLKLFSLKTDIPIL